MSTNKITNMKNADVFEMREFADAFRTEARDITPSVDTGLLLGVYAIATQPEFKGNGDPRPAYIDADTAAYIRTVLVSNGVDVDRSIDIALGREVAA